MANIGESGQVGRNTAYLAAAQLLSQISSAIYVAVLARYVLADGMGKLAIAQAATGIAFVFVNLGLDTLLVRDVAQDRTRANAYLSGAIWIKAGLGVLACAGLALFANVAGYPGDTRVIVYLYAIGTTLRCFTSSIISIWQAFESMYAVSSVRFIRDIINVALSLFAIAASLSLEVIVGISVLANVVELVLVLVMRPVPLSLERRVSIPLLSDLFRRNIPFAGLSIVSALYAQAIVLFLSFVLDSASVGYYSTAHVLLSFLLILPMVLNQVLLPTLSRLNIVARAKLQEAYTYAFRLAWIAGALLTVFVLFAAHQLVSIALGNNYSPSVSLLQVIGLSLFTVPNYVNGALLIAIDRQKLFMVSQMVFLALQLMLAIVLIPTMGILGAAVAFVIPGLIGFVYYTALCHRFLGLDLPWNLTIKISAVVGLTSVILASLHNLGVKWPVNNLVAAPLIFLIAAWGFKVLSLADVRIVMHSLLPEKILMIIVQLFPNIGVRG
jgi:O-antigen/teichoic acid export membrane protein